MKLKIGILGATGLTGAELMRLLLRHPHTELAWLSSESQSGVAYGKIYPAFAGRISDSVAKLIPMQTAWNTVPDLVFSCLPHGASAAAIEPFLKNNKTRVIDLSADFRLARADAPQAVYGLSEIYRAQIAKARLVANPGCYPTSILLPLIPLLRAGVIHGQGIIADSKSGVSGMGRKATEASTFLAINENFSAYKVGDQHRHLPEIREQLSLAANAEVTPLFTPHLVPMERGILSTLYAELAPNRKVADVEACWHKAYAGSPFARPMPDFPQTADVARGNECRFHAYQPAGTSKLIVVSVLDNMVKGASGQALQNMNILFGLEETLGLL